MLGEQVGHREDLIAVQVDVEHGKVNALFDRELQRILHGANRTNGLDLETVEHFLQQSRQQR